MAKLRSFVVLFVGLAVNAFAGNSPTDSNFYNAPAWVVTYQATNGPPQANSSWTETMAAYVESQIIITPLSDAFPNTQSVCSGAWNFLDDDILHPNLTGIGIGSWCVVMRSGVVVGTRRVILRVLASTPSSMGGTFQSDTYDTNGVLLTTITGTVSGTAAPLVTTFPWSDIEALPMN